LRLQGDVSVAHRERAPGHVQTLDQAGVDLASAHRGMVEQLKQEALVRRPVLEDRDRIGERPA
jgi:hypothetical protein